MAETTNLLISPSKKENKKDWRILEYVVPFSHIRENIGSQDDFFIQGVAINETITRNNIKYTAEELEKATPSLANKPMLKDHENKVDNIVGRVREAVFDSAKRAITFRAQVMDKKVREMITDGRLTNVSVGAMVKDLLKSEKEDEDYYTAVGLEFLELSFTPVPGDPGATLTQAIAEAYNKKVSENYTQDNSQPKGAEKSVEQKMVEEKQEINTEMAQLVELKKQLAEKDAILEKIAKEKLDTDNAEYQKLCEKLGISAKTNLAQEQLNLLLPSLRELSEKDDDDEDVEVDEIEEKKTTTKGKVAFAEKNDAWNGFVLERKGSNGALWKMPNSKGEMI